MVKFPVSSGPVLSWILTVPVASKAQPVVTPPVTSGWHALVVLFKMSIRKM